MGREQGGSKWWRLISEGWWQQNKGDSGNEGGWSWPLKIHALPESAGTRTITFYTHRILLNKEDNIILWFERSFKILSTYPNSAHSHSEFLPKPVACHVLRCQSRILERYGLHPQELLRAWGVTTYSRTGRATSAEPHPQINLPERLDSHSG